MNKREKILSISDISTLTWINPILFISHAKLEGDFSHIEATETIAEDRSAYTDDEKLLVQYIQSAVSFVEGKLDFDLQEKQYQEFFEPYYKVETRRDIKTTDGSLSVEVSFNDEIIPTEDIKIVDNVIFIKEIDEEGDTDGGNYVKVIYTVETRIPYPDILQAILMVFTQVYENRGDCTGELCGCSGAIEILNKYRTPLC